MTPAMILQEEEEEEEEEEENRVKCGPKRKYGIPLSS